MALRVTYDEKAIEDFCKRWKVVEFSIFGSALSPEFRADSDVDVLLDFTEEAEWSLLDIVAMKEELEELFGHRVDLLTKRGVEQSANWIRRQAILENRERVYGA